MKKTEIINFLRLILPNNQELEIIQYGNLKKGEKIQIWIKEE